MRVGLNYSTFLFLTLWFHPFISSQMLNITYVLTYRYWGFNKLASLKHTIKKHNVTLADEKRLLLQCNECGKGWSPNLDLGGRLPKGYWKCPNKCNYQEREYKHNAEVRAYFAKRNRDQISKKRNAT